MKALIILSLLLPTAGVPAALLLMPAAKPEPSRETQLAQRRRPTSYRVRFGVLPSKGDARFASEVVPASKVGKDGGASDDATKPAGSPPSAWDALIPAANETAAAATTRPDSEWDKLLPDDGRHEVATAGDASDLPPVIDPRTLPGPIPGSETADIDEEHRFAPTVRPEIPQAQHPPAATEQNVDTNKPVHKWQRATDDWGGLRPQLDDRGIVIQSNLTAEYGKNLRGGVSTNGGDFRHLFNLNLTLESKPLFGYEGGTAFFNFQQQNGQEGLDVGDAQGTSNIDADGRTQISEAWYEQKLLGDKLRVKLGKIDANTEFAYVEHAAEFINSSMGFSPTILGFPTYPDPAFGAVAFVYPCDAFYAGFGVFDGSGQEGKLTGSNGPRTLFGGPSDLFLIGEAGLKWAAARGRDGRLGGGVWHHTGRFDRFDGGTTSGTTGFYAVLDQKLWRENPKPEGKADGEKDAKGEAEAEEEDTQGLGFYLQYGYADADVSEINHHVGAGLAWQGLVPSRDDDVLGLGVSWVRFSDAPGAGFGHDAETTVELFYKLQLTPWVSLKPDLQYIHNPGGVAGRDDALVATLRAVIDF